MQQQPSQELPETTRKRTLLYSAAGLSVMAGLLHVLVMPEHFEEWVGYGLFFLMVAGAQLLYPILLLSRPSSRTVLVVGIVGNALVVGLWAVTRTVGIPLGPAAGEIEAIGLVDMTCKLSELALIGCLLVVLRNTADEN